jgi:hypothetical protein
LHRSGALSLLALLSPSFALTLYAYASAIYYDALYLTGIGAR